MVIKPPGWQTASGLGHAKIALSKPGSGAVLQSCWALGQERKALIV